MERWHIEDLKDPWEQAISRPAADYYWDAGLSSCGGEGGLGRHEPAGARGAAPVRWHQEAAEGHQATPEGCAASRWRDPGWTVQRRGSAAARFTRRGSR
jgi:hypothetical protein